MRFQHLAEAIFHQPWLITPAGHQSVRSLFEARSLRYAKADTENTESDFIVQRGQPSLDANGIGRVYIRGVIGIGLSNIEKTCGNTDTKDVAAEIKALVEQNARAIFLTIDSPGGMVSGTPELGDLISNVALEIPVYVFSEGQICSAAYWIAAGADKILTTESAEIGSIGVILPWVDQSGLWEKAGLRSDNIVNEQGIYKGAGAGPSLTDEQRQNLQDRVERIFGLFKGFVTSMRALNGAVVPDEACRGQTFLGIDSVAQGLVDAVVDCEQDAYDLLVEDLTSGTELDDETEIDFEFPQ